MLKVRVIRPFKHYVVGDVIPEIPAAYREALIQRGLVEIVTEEPVRRKRGRPRKHKV